MRFWDSSAVVPLILNDPTSPRVRALYATDSTMVVWWGTSVECASAISRRGREAASTEQAMQNGFSALAVVRACFQEIEPEDSLRNSAIRILRIHDLRPGDALQLAAALVAARGARRIWTSSAWTRGSSMRRKSKDCA